MSRVDGYPNHFPNPFINCRVMVVAGAEIIQREAVAFAVEPESSRFD
jgi:hypothetical protein